ncbi:MAG TPA: isochorismatase family cysteine hydrolase [Candidatus Binataceae bacterium]|nr:isochorismatase family cysteine hydrolase [Candidatus Binataceae bacterium]
MAARGESAVIERLINGAKPGQQRHDPFHQTVVWNIIPDKTALLVVDMQNAFVHERGLFYLPAARELIAKINRVVTISRDRGIMVVWIVRHPYRRDGLDTGYEQDFLPAMVGNPAGYTEDGWGAQLADGLEVVSERDLIVPKTRYSAFIEGSSNLDRILRYHGRDTVIIMGVATNVCCGTTARDAMMLDYKVIFVSDGNAAGGEISLAGYGPGTVQEAELMTLRACFAMVCTTDELIGEITNPGLARA